MGLTLFEATITYLPCHRVESALHFGKDQRDNCNKIKSRRNTTSQMKNHTTAGNLMATIHSMLQSPARATVNIIIVIGVRIRVLVFAYFVCRGLPPQTQQERPQQHAPQLADPPQRNNNDYRRHRDGGGPVDSHAGRVDGDYAGDGAQRQEDDRHDGEGVERLVVVVFSGLDLSGILLTKLYGYFITQLDSWVLDRLYNRHIQPWTS